MAALIAACGALVAIGTNMWDKLTLSAEEYRKKLDFINARNKEALSEQTKSEADSANIFERLRSLNVEDNGLEIIFLLDKLQKKYGDLGITVDGTTNKILGLDSAQQKIFKLEGKRTLAKAQKNVNGWERTAEADFEPVLEHIRKNNHASAINPKGEDASALIKRFGLDVKMDDSAEKVDYIGPNMTRVVTKRSDEEIRLAKRWNEGGIEGKQEFLESMFDKAKTNEEIDALQKLIDTLDELKAAREILNSQKRYGYTDPKQYQKLLSELDANAAKAKKQILDDIDSKKDFLNFKNEKKYTGLSTAEKLDYLRNNQMATAKEGLETAEAKTKTYIEEIEKIRQAAKEFAATGGPNKLKSRIS
jgi:hypothetical protein